MSILAKFQPAESEQALVCALLARPGILDDVALEVSAGDFYDVATAVIYDGILQLWADGIPIDQTNLIDHLVDAGLSPAQVKVDVSRLGSSTLDFDNPVSYAQRIRGCAAERRFRAKLTRLAEDPRPLEELAAEIVAASMEYQTQSRTWSMRELALDTIETVEQSMAKVKRGERVGINTGIPDVDAILGPLYPGELTGIGAGTSKGKTALMLGIFRWLSIHGERPFMWSGEDSKMSVGPRFNAQQARIPVNRYRAGALDMIEWQGAVSAAEYLANLEGWVNFDSGLDGPAVCQRLRIQALKHRITVAFVDYLQKIRVPKNANKADALGEASNDMKAVAQQCGFHLFVGSQIPREDERSGNPPTKHSLKSCGDFSNDCENILLIHRPKENTDGAVLIVDKNGNGPLGGADVKFSARYTLFEQGEP